MGDKGMDNLLCILLCSLNSVCSDNMIGYRKFCSHKAWKNIRKLLETFIAFNERSSEHSMSDTLHLQVFGLLSCFGVPASFDSWKRTQWDPMFKNAPKDTIEVPKKLTYAERKLKQKQDEKNEQNEYKKSLRIIKEVIRRLGGHVHSTT